MEVLCSQKNSLNLVTCRLCANDCDKAIGIYSEEGLTNHLSSKMNQHLPIKVSQTDTLPLYCCLSCTSTLLTWHELYLVCIESDKRLREFNVIDDKSMDAIEFPDEQSHDVEQEIEPEPEPTTSHELEAMEESDVASLNVFCQKASVKIESGAKTEANFGWLKTEDSPEDMFNPFTQSSTENLKNDLESAVEERDSKQMIKRSVTPDLDGEDKAEAVINMNDWLVKTCDDPETYSYVCQICSSILESEEDVVNHIKTEHSVDIDSSKQDLRKERRRNTKIDQDAINKAKVVVEGKIYYNCKTCGKSLHSPYTYIWHMRIHTGERPFVCDLCGKQFRVSQGLVRHLKETHEGIKNFPCDICGRMFATRRNVEEHRRIHTNERPYICDLCGKAFKQKASLFVHNRSHTNYFPYRCSYCNQGFRTRPPLLIHVTRHTGEKPYPCDVCGRCFRIKYELKRHMLIHSDEKPFVCSECGISFRQKRYLRNHTKINHNRETI